MQARRSAFLFNAMQLRLESCAESVVTNTVLDDNELTVLEYFLSLNVSIYVVDSLLTTTDSCGNDTIATSSLFDAYFRALSIEFQGYIPIKPISFSNRSRIRFICYSTLCCKYSSSATLSRYQEINLVTELNTAENKHYVLTIRLHIIIGKLQNVVLVTVLAFISILVLQLQTFHACDRNMHQCANSVGVVNRRNCLFFLCACIHCVGRYSTLCIYGNGSRLNASEIVNLSVYCESCNSSCCEEEKFLHNC